MKRIFNIGSAARGGLGGMALLWALTVAPSTMHAQVTLFGSPANFDVLNDTGKDAHGFEIELDGITPADLSYVWPASRFPYTVLTTQAGVVIRYASPYVNSQYSITTIVPAAFRPTFGHSCVQGAIQGCEHYGYLLSYYGAVHVPTNTVYRWLVDDPQNPGTLISAPGQIVQIPIPAVVLLPPAAPGLPQAIAFRIPVPPPPPIPKPEPQYGVAKWVKVLKSEAQKAVVVDDLLEDNPVVPNDGNPAQVETDWALLQFNPHSPNSGIMHSQANVGQGARAVVRKYEFYKYSGKLDPNNGKALCGGDGLCTTPLAGELGDFIGNQMAAANVGISSLTVVRAGAGSGTVNGAGKINCGGACSLPLALGTAVTLTEKPASNSTFTGWTGDCVGTQPTCTFNIGGENTVTATFAVAAAGGGGGGGGGAASFKVSISKNGNGTVTSDPAAQTFASGTVVTLTATPGAGQPWIGWGGDCSGTATTCTLTMNANKAVTANFR